MDILQHTKAFISSISGKEKEGGYKEVFLNSIIWNPSANIRSKLTGLDDLQNSLIQQGMIQPVILLANGDGKYKILDGHRRIKCCMNMVARNIDRFSKVPAIIKENVDDIEIAMLTQGIQKESLTDMDIARAISISISRNNLSQKEMAERLGKSKVYVSEILSASAIYDAFMADESVSSDKRTSAEPLKSTFLCPFTSIKDVSLRNRLIRLAIRRGGTVRDAKAVISLWKSKMLTKDAPDIPAEVIAEAELHVNKSTGELIVRVKDGQVLERIRKAVIAAGAKSHVSFVGQTAQ